MDINSGKCTVYLFVTFLFSWTDMGRVFLLALVGNINVVMITGPVYGYA